MSQRSPQMKQNSPLGMVLGRHRSDPSFGTSLESVIPSMKMPVTLGCGAGGTSPAECEFHEFLGIWTQKFTATADMLKTKKAGVVTDSCRGTVSTAYATRRRHQPRRVSRRGACGCDARLPRAHGGFGT